MTLIIGSRRYLRLDILPRRHRLCVTETPDALKVTAEATIAAFSD